MWRRTNEWNELTVFDKFVSFSNVEVGWFPTIILAEEEKRIKWRTDVLLRLCALVPGLDASRYYPRNTNELLYGLSETLQVA